MIVKPHVRHLLHLTLGCSVVRLCRVVASTLLVVILVNNIPRVNIACLFYFTRIILCIGMYQDNKTVRYGLSMATVTSHLLKNAMKSSDGLSAKLKGVRIDVIRDMHCVLTEIFAVITSGGVSHDYTDLRMSLCYMVIEYAGVTFPLMTGLNEGTLSGQSLSFLYPRHGSASRIRLNDLCSVIHEPMGPVTYDTLNEMREMKNVLICLLDSIPRPNCLVMQCPYASGTSQVIKMPESTDLSKCDAPHRDLISRCVNVVTPALNQVTLGRPDYACLVCQLYRSLTPVNDCYNCADPARTPVVVTEPILRDIISNMLDIKHLDELDATVILDKWVEFTKCPELSKLADGVGRYIVAWWMVLVVQTCTLREALM